MKSTLELQEPEVQERIERAQIEIRPSQGVAARQRPIFADVLLDGDGQQRGRRTSTTVFSFIFHCLLIGGLVLVPLWYTDNLPKQQLLTFLVAPPPPPPPPPPRD
jgi:hypothetical protein